MVFRYGTQEIIGIAETVEENASKFYAQAAEMVDDAAVKEMLLGLSKMEKGHAKVFAAMKGDLSEKEKEVETHDPGNEMLYYLQGTAEIHGWEGKRDPNTQLTGKESIKDILNIAIEAEKEAVFLYTGLKDCVPAGNGKDKIEQIIREEMKHCGVLTKQLQSLQG